MLALLLSWFLLAAAAWRTGAWLSARCGGRCGVRDPDEVLQELFLGLLAVAVGLLGFSLVCPTRYALPLLAILAWGGPRAPAIPLRSAWLPALLLAACVSLGLISSRDSMTYHHDLIHYLAEGGIPPGLAWIHGRFGYLSSWFALHACFDQPALGLAGRMDSLGNGALLALALAHLAAGLRRWTTGTADLATRFAVLAWMVVLPLPIYLNYVCSPTPDFPVIVSTVFLAWMLLRGGPGIDPGRQARLALLLGACAFALKLSAAPLPAAAAWACLKRGGFSRDHFRAGAWASLPVGIWLTAVWLASGYPVFPVTWHPIDVDWRIPEHAANLQRATVHGFAYWGMATRPEHMAGVETYSLVWLRHWLGVDPVNAVGGAAFAATVFCIPWVLARTRLRRTLAPIFPVALLGSLYLTALAPAPRFGLGFLILLPAGLAAALAPGRCPARFRIGTAGLAIVLLVLVSPTWLRPTRSERRIAAALRTGVIRLEPQARWLRPPLIPHLHYDDARDIAFLPDPERSHNAPNATRNVRAAWYLPLALDGGVYRDPARGWRGGFKGPLAGGP